MRKLVVVLCLLLFSGACKMRSVDTVLHRDYPHYDLQLALNPGSAQISVSGTLTIPAPVPETMTFYLARTLTIEQFTTDQGHIMTVDSSPSDIRFMPEARRVTLKSANGSTRRGAVTVRFSCRGTLPQLPEFFANTTGKDWTEIGMYYPWFPLEWEHVRVYTYRVAVSTGTGDKVFGLGQTRLVDGKWVVVSQMPTNDIVIFASPDVQRYASGAVTVYHQGLSAATLDRMGTDLNRILDLEQAWFGGTVDHVSIVVSKREKGGGYARIGGVVLGGLDDAGYAAKHVDFQRYFGHELAHLWWFRAPADSWEDWLNEGFAEYTALMILRQVAGEAEYQKRLDAKRKTCLDTPPILGFDRNGADWRIANRVLYDKAPVLLAELEQRMGKEVFLTFCRELLTGDVMTTAQFLERLAGVSDPETTAWFRQQLESR